MAKKLGKLAGLDRLKAEALPTSSPAAARRARAAAEPDAQLTVMLPASVVKAVKHSAVERGETLRATVLRAFKSAGIAVPDHEIADRRAEANRRRAGA
jgi:hypothetical protein